jgi:hypothetical protein
MREVDSKRCVGSQGVTTSVSAVYGRPPVS